MMRRPIILFCIIAAIMLGALREFLFLNLNYQIDHVARHTGISYAHSLFQGWVKGWDLRSLIILKWVLALCFIGAMWGLCVLIARPLFAPRRLEKPLALAFLAIGGAAILFHWAAQWAAPMESVSVKLLHLLQYPVPLFFLWAAAMLVRHERARSI